METYVMLGKFTGGKGKEHIREIPARLKNWQTVIEESGGKWIGHYLLVGRYDALIIFQFPDRKFLTTLLLVQNSIGYLEAETMLAWSDPDIEEIIANLP
jgi:uncharacterized protein with GYD domain